MFKAGPAAYRSLRQEGFDAGRIGSLVGASGGAKWLVLSQLDRVIVSRLLPKFDAPVYTLGSSIGAWRFACYARRDPLAAIVTRRTPTSMRSPRPADEYLQTLSGRRAWRKS